MTELKIYLLFPGGNAAKIPGVNLQFPGGMVSYQKQAFSVSGLSGKEDAYMELMKLLETRRTYRRFDQSRPVPEEAAADMKEALRLSSSGGNRQPLRFVFARDPETVEAIFPHTRFAALLPKELGTPKEGEHPVMYTAVIYHGEKHPKAPDTDAGLALSNLTLAAWAHGIGSCIMANIDREDIAALLKIPSPWKIHTVVALGYPTHTAAVTDPGEDGSLDYYLDQEKNYLVPKLPVSRLVSDEAFHE